MVIFKGSNGVRAGWRFLAFAALFFGLSYIFSFPLGWLGDALRIPNAWYNVLGPGQMAFQEVGLLIPVALTTYVMARLERRSILSYGFTPQPRAPGLYFEGAVVAFVLAALAAVLMIAFGGMHIAGLGLRGSDWLIYPLGWLIVMLLVGFVEEAMFRGYPLYALSRGMGFWPAAIVMTLLFGAGHVGKTGENAVDIGSVMFLGFTMCVAINRTGSLWFATGFHFMFDLMQFFVIGTRNGSQTPQGTLFSVTFPGPAWVNGGPLGTEASYFVFPLTVAMLAFILWRFRASPPSLEVS
jgi:uncharacterized protein